MFFSIFLLISPQTGRKRDRSRDRYPLSHSHLLPVSFSAKREARLNTPLLNFFPYTGKSFLCLCPHNKSRSSRCHPSHTQKMHTLPLPGHCCYRLSVPPFPPALHSRRRHYPSLIFPSLISLCFSSRIRSKRMLAGSSVGS